ncbi:MAG TPA: glucosamine-6-phosphate deaminase [Bryobacteraceae bacterium]|nr:glucosamine-6-phosphate deaminase [Bryobacteraceae bacterium]
MVQIFSTKAELAAAAAALAAERLRDLLARQSQVRLLAATGASQLEFLDCLAAAEGIDWQRVELFHLDEYVGLSRDHPASFSGYIKQRIVDRMGIVQYHLLDGTRDAREMAAEAGQTISAAPVDLAFAGIGENGHLAFNDPPADFEIEDPYLVVELDQACRQQQVGEGWFATLEEVPRQAISISIHQLLKTREILCVVPDERKASAVRACLVGPISPEAPASILRVHPNTTIFLDTASASLLSTI